jgi:hypothetical protein
MAQDKTLNDLIVQVQATNIRLETLADSGDQQESHLKTLAKASKVDRLQNLEDKREESSSSPTSAVGPSSDTIKGDDEGSGMLMRSTMMAGLITLMQRLFTGLGALLTVGGLAALGLGALKIGLLAGLVGAIAFTAVRAVTNYFGVTEIWDKAMKDLMAGKINGGSIGAGVGGVVGGIVGSVGGLPGIIIGAMVGSAVGAILGNFVEKKWEASSEGMKNLMMGKIAVIGGMALIGAGLGVPGGPPGIIAGLLLGMAAGALITYIADIGGKAIDGVNWGEVIDEFNMAVNNWALGVVDSIKKFFSGDAEINKRMVRVTADKWKKRKDPVTGETNEDKYADNVMGAYHKYVQKGDNSVPGTADFSNNGDVPTNIKGIGTQAESYVPMTKARFDELYDERINKRMEQAVFNNVADNTTNMSNTQVFQNNMSAIYEGGRSMLAH